jgi:phosphoglycerate kinase
MISALPQATLSGKKVFLRADLNVPLLEGTVVDTFRLEALQPTLDLLYAKQSCTIIGTHLGRPHGFEEPLSTKHLVPWFLSKGYSITWAPTLADARKAHKPGTFVLLENVRFFKGEKGRDPLFAQELHELASYYVNDAWGVLEQEDTSITLLPALYKPDEKTIGLCVEKELSALARLRHPQRPFLMILGGAKLNEKLPEVERALDHADIVYLLPPLVNTFMKAQGIEVGDSLVDDTLIPLAQTILTKSLHSRAKLIIPSDFLIGNKDLTGSLQVSSASAQGQISIALGPHSLEQCIHEVQSAASIFFNGPMGFFERPDTLEPLYKLLQAIAQSNTISVVGGGESIAAVKLFGLEKEFTFCSTGGGTTLHYILTGSLPGLHFLS